MGLGVFLFLFLFLFILEMGEICKGGVCGRDFSIDKRDNHVLFCNGI